jgi:hypothetical protein
MGRKIQQLSDSGVVLLIGTDSGIPRNSLSIDLAELMPAE